MIVHELDFTDVQRLARAYELIALDGSSGDCAIDLDLLRLSFAVRPPIGDRLVEQIHRAGGLHRARSWPALAPELADV